MNKNVQHSVAKWQPLTYHTALFWRPTPAWRPPPLSWTWPPPRCGRWCWDRGSPAPSPWCPALPGSCGWETSKKLWFHRCFDQHCTYRWGVGIVPVEFVGDDVLAAVVGLLPLQLDGGGADLHRGEAARLARHPLLGLHLDRVGQGSGADASVGLHPAQQL